MARQSVQLSYRIRIEYSDSGPRHVSLQGAGLLPFLGRFLQTDPVGYDDQFNLYAYAGNDPVNGTDPSGLAIVTGSHIPGKGGGLAVGLSGTSTFFEALEADSGADAADDEQDGSWTDLIPGKQGYDCLFVRSCSWTDIGSAVLDVTPLGRVNAARKGLQLVRRALRACGCLEAGTLVATPEGLQPIEDIEVGDLVLAMNEETGEIAPQRVTDLIRPEAKPLYALSLRDSGGEIELFHATDDHPWRVHGRGWVETADLRAGDRIDTAGADDLVVTSLQLTSRVERTYNLTVDNWHTFLIGEDRAVVHNACPSPNQLNQAINRGQAPSGIRRVDVGRVRGEQTHVHVNGGALNRDGTWKHRPSSPLTNSQRRWLRDNGWTLP